MKFSTAILILMSVLLLVGCAGKKETTGVSPATKEVMASIPDWYMSPPSDPNFIIETGTAISQDMQLARDKAADQARMGIAKTIETKFEGLSKRIQEEVGTDEDAQYLDMFTQATKAVVSTTLSGASIDKADIKPEGERFRAYVLMKMPIGASSEALLKKLKQQEQMYTRFRSTQVFEELEKETEKFEQFKKEEGTIAP